MRKSWKDGLTFLLPYSGLPTNGSLFSVKGIWFHIHYRPRSEGDNTLSSVRPSIHLSVCPFVCALMAEPVDLEPLSSAAKSNKSHYQCKVFVCVSVSSGRIRIIAQTRSFGILIWLFTLDSVYWDIVNRGPAFQGVFQCLRGEVYIDYLFLHADLVVPNKINGWTSQTNLEAILWI